MKNGAMNSAAFHTIKQALLREVDQILWRDLHQSLAEVLNDLYIRRFTMRIDPLSDDVFRVMARAGVLDTLANPKALELRDALQRLERGTFGLCLHCGEELPVPLLEQEPTARYCPPCSEAKKKPDLKTLMTHLSMNLVAL